MIIKLLNFFFSSHTSSSFQHNSVKGRILRGLTNIFALIYLVSLKKSKKENDLKYLKIFVAEIFVGGVKDRVLWAGSSDIECSIESVIECSIEPVISWLRVLLSE